MEISNNQLNKKVALVTGASRGIGRSIALTLAQQGVNIALAARSSEQLEQVCAQIKANGGHAYCFNLDISKEQDAVNLVQDTVNHFGKLDILINNAGMGTFGPVAQTSTAKWDEIMNVNARGPFILCRESIAHLKQQDISYIINISSVVGIKGYKNQCAYAASKHALMGMTKVLARETSDLGIRVHAICPGGVDTDLVSNARPDLDRSVLMQPQDIADIVLFLVTRSSNAVIDQIHVRRASSMPWA